MGYYALLLYCVSLDSNLALILKYTKDNCYSITIRHIPSNKVLSKFIEGSFDPTRSEDIRKDTLARLCLIDLINGGLWLLQKNPKSFGYEPRFIMHRLPDLVETNKTI